MTHQRAETDDDNEEEAVEHDAPHPSSIDEEDK